MGKRRGVGNIVPQFCIIWSLSTETIFLVILLMVPSEALDSYMRVAEEMQMGSDSEYVFVHYHWLEGMSGIEEVWNGPTNRSWNNLFLMSLYIPNQLVFTEFMYRVVS